jgi:hypothetical protein
MTASLIKTRSRQMRDVRVGDPWALAAIARCTVRPNETSPRMSIEYSRWLGLRHGLKPRAQRSVSRRRQLDHRRPRGVQGSGLRFSRTIVIERGGAPALAAASRDPTPRHNDTGSTMRLAAISGTHHVDSIAVASQQIQRARW